MFMINQARSNIQTSISFCTTEVRGPDGKDWKNLNIVFTYLKIMIDLPLTLQDKFFTVVKWWVDE